METSKKLGQKHIDKHATISNDILRIIKNERLADEYKSELKQNMVNFNKNGEPTNKS